MFKQSFPYVIAVVILVLIYSLLGYPLLKKNSEAKKLLAENLSTLKEIYSSSNLPSDELITAMEKGNMEFLDKYKKLIEKLPIAKEVSLPEGVNLPLFFLEELKNVKEKLRTKASEKGIQILTEDLGFLNILPSDQEAPDLIKNLYITEMIANLLIEAGVSSIDFIEVGVVEKTDAYEGIPLILTVNCDISSLANLLFTLENTDEGFFTVKDFSLVSTTIENKEVSANSSSSVTYGENMSDVSAGYSGGPSSIVEEKKSIQTDLELSVIRWRGL